MLRPLKGVIPSVIVALSMILLYGVHAQQKTPTSKSDNPYGKGATLRADPPATIYYTSLNGAPFGATNQSQLPQLPGCGCGQPKYFDITPDPVNTKAGQITEIKLDGTTLCNGQSVRGFTGKVSWENQAGETLGDSYGFLRHQYVQGGNQLLRIDISGVCYDDGAAHCANTCSYTRTVKVTVIP